MIEQEQSHVDAVLVGYENQENLGLRSLLACLCEHGIGCALLPFSPARADEVLEEIVKRRPRLVGFSVIFQNTIEEFGSLARRLRTAGVAAHLTAGGHFPSLRPEETFRLVPELDSIVRFEGEETLRDLIENLDRGETWHEIRGLAFRRDSTVVINPVRPLVADLDTLPLVWRDRFQETPTGIRMAAMLASRGCLLNCSFCSIRQFYGSTPGRLRRVRSPGHVVDEMASLHRESGVRFFSFQDDDFAMRSADQRAWLREFLEKLRSTGIAERIRWKISCRVDDLDSEILDEMMSCGLLGVYLGVESGTDSGLRHMRKNTTARQNLAAVDLLKRKGLGTAIGFMMLDPWSTLETVAANIGFLKAIGDDGYLPVNFGKMLPYAGTPVEQELLQAGRLRGSTARPDYSYSDPGMQLFEYLMDRIFARRNFQRDGLVALLQEAEFSYRLAASFGLPQATPVYGSALRELTRQSNELALSTLSTLCEEISSAGVEAVLEGGLALDLATREWEGEAALDLKLRELELDQVLVQLRAEKAG